MAIVAGDLLYKFSVAAAAGNMTAGTAAGSLGDQISTTQITDATVANLFGNQSAADNAAGVVKYRCFFVHNNHGSITWDDPVVWLLSETAGGASIAISVDTTGATAIGSGSAQAKTVANETTAPTSQTFSSPTTKGTGLALPDIPPGQCVAIWVRLTNGASAAISPDGVVLRVEGNTT